MMPYLGEMLSRKDLISMSRERSGNKALLSVLVAIILLSWPLNRDEAPFAHPSFAPAAVVKSAKRGAEGRVTQIAAPALSQAQEFAEPTYPILYVTGDLVNVRAGPTTDDPVVGRARSGDRALEFGRSGGWVRLRLEKAGIDGWMSDRYLARSGLATRLDAGPPHEPSAGAAILLPAGLSDDDIRRDFIRESIARYPGSCPCPFNVDPSGRRCGERSARARPGSAPLFCYPADVPESAVAAYRQILAR